MTIRRATAADLDALERLLDRCSTRTRTLRFSIPMRSLPRAYARSIARPARGEAHWVAENGGEIAALASVSGAEVAVLVEDAWQRRGLGTRVLERAVDDAARHGVTELVADVAFESTHTIRMLSRLGDAAVSVTPEGYRLVMKLATRTEPCSTARTRRRTARSRAHSRS